jgi:hypothetical protein
MDDTPPEPLPTRRASGEHVAGGVDSVFMFEMRRELMAEMKASRRETSEAMNEVRLRLGAIETNMAAGAQRMEQHDGQLKELIDVSAELDQRLAQQEALRVADLSARLKVLEDAELQRSRDEYARARVAATPSRLNGVVDDMLSSAGKAFGAAVIAAVAGAAWYAFTTWVKAGAPTAPGARP